MLEQKQLNEKLVRFSKEFLGKHCRVSDEVLSTFDFLIEDRVKLSWLLHYEVMNYCLALPNRKLQDDFMTYFAKTFKETFSGWEVHELRRSYLSPQDWVKEVKVRGNWSFTLKKLEDAYKKHGVKALDSLFALVGSSCFNVDFKQLAWYYHRASNDLQRDLVVDFLKGCGYEDVALGLQQGRVLEYMK